MKAKDFMKRVKEVTLPLFSLRYPFSHIYDCVENLVASCYNEEGLFNSVVISHSRRIIIIDKEELSLLGFLPYWYAELRGNKQTDDYYQVFVQLNKTEIADLGFISFIDTIGIQNEEVCLSYDIYEHKTILLGAYNLETDEFRRPTRRNE